MIFGDGVGASLVRGPYCQLDVGLCDVDVFLHWNSAAEEGAWVGLKPDLQGGTGFNLLRVHFWTPVQRKRVSKRGQKVARLKSKVVPPGGSSFGPFLAPSRPKRDQNWTLQGGPLLISSGPLSDPFLKRVSFARGSKNGPSAG